MSFAISRWLAHVVQPGRSPQRRSIRLSKQRESEGLPPDAFAALEHAFWPASATTLIHVAGVAVTAGLHGEVLMLDPWVLEAPAALRTGRAQHLLSTSRMVNAFFEFVSSGLIGMLCDKIGRRPVAVSTQMGQLIEFIFFAACARNCIFASAEGLKLYNVGAWVIGARSVSGILGNFMVPLKTYVADVSTPATLPQNFGRQAVASFCGLVAGPLLGLVLLSLACNQAVYLFAAATSVCNIACIVWMWPSHRDVGKVVPWEQANPFVLFRGLLQGNFVLRIYCTMNFIDHLALNMVFSAMPLFMLDRFGWHGANILCFFIALGVCNALACGILMPFLIDHCGEVWTLKFGYFASWLSFVCFSLAGLTSSGILFACVLPIFAAGVISGPVQTGMANREVGREELGRLAGAYSIAETVGKFVAPLLTGLIVERTIRSSFPSFVFFAASLCLLPGILLAFLVERFTVAVDVGEAGLLPGVELQKSPKNEDRLI